MIPLADFVYADPYATLIENAGEQAVIRDIQGMRARGMVLTKIAAELTERRIPTKTGKSDSWTHQAVARILKRDG